MTAAPGVPGTHRRSGLADRTVVVIGAGAGIGLEVARQVRADGGRLVLVGRNPERLRQAALELEPVGTAAFDATDTDRLQRFFQDLPGPVDHVLVTAGGPYYMPLESMDLADARRAFDERIALALGVALYSRDKIRAGGTLLFIGGTGGRRPGVGMAVASAATAALPALVANLALEMAPVRVNLIAAGFVDTPCRPRCSGTGSMPGARNCGPRFPSDGWSARPTSPLSPYTSCATTRSRARRTTSTAASNSSRTENHPGPVAVQELSSS
ncbi:hypothetical protein GCM10010317_072220 [Streptomyces mirabilis]|uniref:SDR family NAD(P)-dependent oxidoreductase n=1 Tax=Streptomyces mirabilis TaxID=68239 RepID=UPI0019A6CDEA|nr:SDR family NAD(P)-dependent oxidoreductase [Streptomyces mirabilis]GHD68324.1 hypothetical protein GCM10010317_072220 [Streptomyces mirabilis]